MVERRRAKSNASYMRRKIRAYRKSSGGVGTGFISKFMSIISFEPIKAKLLQRYGGPRRVSCNSLRRIVIDVLI